MTCVNGPKSYDCNKTVVSSCFGVRLFDIHGVSNTVFHSTITDGKEHEQEMSVDPPARASVVHPQSLTLHPLASGAATKQASMHQPIPSTSSAVVEPMLPKGSQDQPKLLKRKSVEFSSAVQLGSSPQQVFTCFPIIGRRRVTADWISASDGCFAAFILLSDGGWQQIGSRLLVGVLLSLFQRRVVADWISASDRCFAVLILLSNGG